MRKESNLNYYLCALQPERKMRFEVASWPSQKQKNVYSKSGKTVSKELNENSEQ